MAPSSVKRPAKASVAAVVLAAGKGTRMKSVRPKELHPIAGRPILRYALDTARAAGAERIVVVIARDAEPVAAAVAPYPTVVQDPPRGTADAVKSARPLLGDFTGDVLVMFGDTPFVTPATVRKLLAARRKPMRDGRRPTVALLGMRPADPGMYGRLIEAADGTLERIVEMRDASPAEKTVGFCNSGVMAIDGRVLFKLLDEIRNDNSQGEYYLTDLVAVARRRGLVSVAVEGPAAEFLGINSRGELASAEAIMQTELRRRALEGGATLIEPHTVVLSHDTRFGRDVTVEPYVVFGPGCRVGDDVVIRSFSHLEGTTIAAGATIGPFARLRPGADIGEGAHIGNFVEVKKSTIKRGAKVNHLTYIGDASVGERANIGAGTITCNYDGYNKFRTDIGAGAFIGSNSSLVAPVKIGAGAVTGAGSVVTKNVPADALSLTRAPQRDIAGWAKKRRVAQAAAKSQDKARSQGKGINKKGIGKNGDAGHSVAKTSGVEKAAAKRAGAKAIKTAKTKRADTR